MRISNLPLNTKEFKFFALALSFILNISNGLNYKSFQPAIDNINSCISLSSTQITVLSCESKYYMLLNSEPESSFVSSERFGQYKATSVSQGNDPRNLNIVANSTLALTLSYDEQSQQFVQQYLFNLTSNSSTNFNITNKTVSMKEFHIQKEQDYGFILLSNNSLISFFVNSSNNDSSANYYLKQSQKFELPGLISYQIDRQNDCLYYGNGSHIFNVTLSQQNVNVTQSNKTVLTTQIQIKSDLIFQKFQHSSFIINKPYFMTSCVQCNNSLGRVQVFNYESQMLNPNVPIDSENDFPRLFNKKVANLSSEQIFKVIDIQGNISQQNTGIGEQIYLQIMTEKSIRVLFSSRRNQSTASREMRQVDINVANNTFNFRYQIVNSLNSGANLNSLTFKQGFMINLQEEQVQNESTAVIQIVPTIRYSQQCNYDESLSSDTNICSKCQQNFGSTSTQAAQCSSTCKDLALTSQSTFLMSIGYDLCYNPFDPNLDFNKASQNLNTQSSNSSQIEKSKAIGIIVGVCIGVTIFSILISLLAVYIIYKKFKNEKHHNLPLESDFDNLNQNGSSNFKSNYPDDQNCVLNSQRGLVDKANSSENRLKFANTQSQKQVNFENQNHNLSFKHQDKQEDNQADDHSKTLTFIQDATLQQNSQFASQQMSTTLNPTDLIKRKANYQTPSPLINNQLDLNTQESSDKQSNSLSNHEKLLMRLAQTKVQPMRSNVKQESTQQLKRQGFDQSILTEQDEQNDQTIKQDINMDDEAKSETNSKLNQIQSDQEKYKSGSITYLSGSVSQSHLSQTD
eukprot:403334921